MYIVITTTGKQGQDLLHKVFGAWQHLALQALADGLQQRTTTLFSLVAAFLLLHAQASLIQIELIVPCLQSITRCQFLAF